MPLIAYCELKIHFLALMKLSEMASKMIDIMQFIESI